MNRKHFLSFAGWALLLSAASCTLIAKSDLKAGIGVACTVNDDCQNADCDNGVCANKCNVDKDCIAPTLCISNHCHFACKQDTDCPANNVCLSNHTCTPSIGVAMLTPGPTNGEDGWSTSNKVAMDSATTNPDFSTLKLGMSKYGLKDAIPNAKAYDDAIATFAGQGAKVIITIDPTGNTEAISKAPANPNVDFITIQNRAASASGASPPAQNVGVYYQYPEPAWYAAGRLAYRAMHQAGGGNPCIGMIAPTPTHEVVRNINAFTRGARFQANGDPKQPKVVIRWLGGQEDPTPNSSYQATNFSYNKGGISREEKLTAEVVDMGCPVVAHMLSSQRVVAAVQSMKNIAGSGAFSGLVPFSMASDLQFGCRSDLTENGDVFDRCLGSLWWDWSGEYNKILELVVKNQWKGIAENVSFSSVNLALHKFELSSAAIGSAGIGMNEMASFLADAANDTDMAFIYGVGSITNPMSFKFTGQRDPAGSGMPTLAGQTISSDPVPQKEQDHMCWFVEGVYEIPDLTVAGYADFTKLVPAVVPGGPVPAANTLAATAMNTVVSVTASDAKYGDVKAFITGNLSQDPNAVMNCSTSP